jgi:hypothetical protein
MTKNEKIKIFSDYSFDQKIAFILHFYNSVKSKTNNPEYLSVFDFMIEKVSILQENQVNSDDLVQLYNKIIDAEQRTQERRMNEKREFLIQLQKKEEFNDNDLDEYLIQQLVQI